MPTHNCFNFEEIHPRHRRKYSKLVLLNQIYLFFPRDLVQNLFSQTIFLGFSRDLIRNIFEIWIEKKNYVLAIFQFSFPEPEKADEKPAADAQETESEPKTDEPKTDDKQQTNGDAPANGDATKTNGDVTKDQEKETPAIQEDASVAVEAAS